MALTKQEMLQRLNKDFENNNQPTKTNKPSFSTGKALSKAQMLQRLDKDFAGTAKTTITEPKPLGFSTNNRNKGKAPKETTYKNPRVEMKNRYREQLSEKSKVSNAEEKDDITAVSSPPSQFTIDASNPLSVSQELEKIERLIKEAEAKVSKLEQEEYSMLPGDLTFALDLAEKTEERQKAMAELRTLEAYRAEYKKLDELNSFTTEITSKEDFEENSVYSPTVPKTAEQLKAEGYKQDVDGKWYKNWGFGFREGYTGEDSDVYTYINDESKRLSLEVDRELLNGTNYKHSGYHLLTEDEKGAYNYLYHQDRENGTNTAEEYLKNISPLLEKRAMSEEAKRYAEISKEAPALMSAVSLGTNLGNALMFPAKTIATAMGVYDDAPFLDMYGNRTQAIRGAVSEDMPYWGKLLYNGAMSIGDMGVSLASGNPTLAQAIMSSSAGSSAISNAKNNGASDGKALMLGLGSAAIEWATEKYSIEAILKKPETILGYLATNTATEATEEGASNVGNVALDAVVSWVFGERNEIEQRIDELIVYEGKTPSEALQIAFNEKAQSLGEDMLVGGLTGMGMSTVAASPYIASKGIEKIQNAKANNVKKGETIEDSSVVLEKDERTYPYEMQEVIEGYEDAVNDELLTQIEKVKSGNYKDNDTVYFSGVSDKAAQKIKSILGIDVSGFKSAIEARQIKHILKRHGEKGIADTSMRNDSDIARIEFILDNFDNINFGGTTEAYTTVKSNGHTKTANTVEYSKKINGTYYVIQAVPDTKRKTLYIVSAYIGNEKVGTEQLADVSSPDATSDNGFAHIPTGSSIPHSTQNVNSENTEISQKSPLEVAEAKANEAAFEAGRQNVPRDKVNLETPEQEEAYNNGRIEYIKNMNSENSSRNNIENSSRMEYNENKGAEKKAIRTKKSDWASADVEWHTPNQKTPIAYSTKAASDLIEALADENPSATISELKDLITYDAEAKKVLQQYIDAGYGEQVANEWFSYNRKHGYSNNALAQHEAREKRMREFMSRFGLTEDEAYAVNEYKSSEAYKINAKLREDESLLDETQKELVKHIDSALEKLPKHTGKSYRTISFDDVFNPEEEYNAFLEQHTVDGFVEYGAYTSASTVAEGHPMPDDTKYGITLEIDGVNARNFEGFGNNFEKEVVFPRGLFFVVTEVSKDTKGRPYIKIKEINKNGRLETPPKEQSNVLQQVQTERTLHGSMYKISERDTARSGDTENSVQGVRSDKEREIENAVKSTLKQEIISNAELMKMLQEKFGGDVIYAISSEVMSSFEKNGNLGKFEALFADGGEKIYNALKNSSQDSDYLQEDFSNERKGSILSIGSGERSYSASTRKQTKRVDGRTSRYREGRSTAYERRKHCQALRASGSTRQEVVHGHKCEVIPKEHYTPRMTKISESNKKDGFDETVFITGKATIPFVTDTNGKPKTARGAFLEVNGKKIAIVQYDNEFYTPEQISDHEKIHNRRGTPLLEKAKNIIMNSLSVAEKNHVLEKLSKDYNGIIQGNEEAIMEEFVANVLSDMDTEYVNEFEDIRKAYWKGDEAFIDNFKVSEYAESIEAGGANSKVLDNIGFGNENELNSSNELYLAPDEYAVIAKAIMAKNADLSDNELNPIDYVYSANNLYVYRNHSLGEFTAISKFDLVVDKEILPIIKEAVKNGSYSNGQTFNNWSGGVWSDRGGNNSHPKWVENSGAAIYDGGLPVGTRRGNDVGYSRGDGSDPSGNNVKYSVDSNETYTDKLTSQPDNKTFGQNINVSSEDDAKFWDEWFNKAKEYGTIPSGENPHREVNIPRKTEKDRKVSQTVRTILEAKATPDEAVPPIEKLVEDGAFSYDAYTDKKAINDAESYLNEYGWAESLNDWLKDVEQGVVSKQHTAMGWALYNNAANTAATTTSESEKRTAIQTSIQILDAMISHQRSAAQALQATRILKNLSPETQLYGVQKSVQSLQRKLIDKYGNKAPDLKIDEKLAEDFLKAQTQDEREAIEREIYKSIGRQIPSRFIDKWNAWRYLAMLGNLRTHIRNIAGNAGFAPVVFVKNLTATGIEAIVHRVSGKRTVRGKAVFVSRTLLKAAWNDYAVVSDLISNGGKYNDSAMANHYIEEGRKIFNLKPLEWARKANSSLLEKEDMWFSRPHYAYALAQYCKKNNITAEQIENGKAIAPAREYAIKEAQKATYRDTNAFSQMVSELGRSRSNNKSIAKKAFNTVVEGILPFRKTPANILARGVEYSPLWLLKALSYDLVQVSRGKMSAIEVIDNVSSGLTGTGLMALGVLLAAQGLIRGHGEDDKDEKEFKELMGHQAYALELPDGNSITLDWLAPEALPFFVGVNLWESTKASGEKASLSTILKSVTHISEPMLEMSCLQSLNDLFENIGYASSNDTSGLVSVLASAATSYIMQGIPTLLGQAERTGEENRMATHTEKNMFLTGDMQYTLGKISAKIPFWDYNQIPYIDAWGRKEASGTALKRGLNNFLNPSYTSTIDTSDMEKELLRLYETTGENAVFPSRADKYFTVDGKRKNLTAEEYVKYATLKGEKSYKVITDLVKSKAYKNLSDEEKAKAIAEAYTYADQKAKRAISNYNPDKWVTNADEFGSNVGNYLSFRANVSKAKEDNEGKLSKQEVADIIMDMVQNDSESWLMYLSMYENESADYARANGIQGETYMEFLDSLDKADKPTESGKYGTYTQEEAYEAIKNLTGLSKQDKAILWQSVNKNWKSTNNPFR